MASRERESYSAKQKNLRVGRALQLRDKNERERIVEDLMVCKGTLTNTHKMLEGMCCRNWKGWRFIPRLTSQIGVVSRETQETDHKDVRPGN